MGLRNPAPSRTATPQQLAQHARRLAEAADREASRLARAAPSDMQRLLVARCAHIIARRPHYEVVVVACVADQVRQVFERHIQGLFEKSSLDLRHVEAVLVHDGQCDGRGAQRTTEKGGRSEIREAQVAATRRRRDRTLDEEA